jgi:hypothetical protein
MSLSSKAEEQGSRLVRRKGGSVEMTGFFIKTGVLDLVKRDGVAWEN